MANEAGQQTPARPAPRAKSQQRHWWRWVLASIAALFALVALAAAIFIRLQPSPAPLALPSAAASPPAGPLDGAWDVAAGSVAGFRVRQIVLGMSASPVVGRTNAVTGAIAISGNRVTRAAFRIDLTTIKVGGKPRPQFAESLGTKDHPSAAVTLTEPVTLGTAFTSGATVITAAAAGRLTMNGVSHPVTITIAGRRDGAVLQAAGSIRVAFSEWRIRGPKGYRFLGSLADRGTAEFLLVLRRSDGTGHGDGQVG